MPVIVDPFVEVAGDAPAAPGMQLWARLEWESDAGWIAEVVLSFTGHEEISRPFSFEVSLELRGPPAGPPPAAEDLVGRRASLSWGYEETDIPARHVTGEITGAWHVHAAHAAPHLVVELGPPLLSAALSRRSRPFADMDPIAAAKEALREHLAASPCLTVADLRLRTDVPVRPLLVQWEESDLAFAERRLSEAGVTFHFEHEARTARLVLHDADEGREREAQGALQQFGWYHADWPGFDTIRFGLRAGPRRVGARALARRGSEVVERVWERNRPPMNQGGACATWEHLHVLDPALGIHQQLHDAAEVEGQRSDGHRAVGSSRFPNLRPGVVLPLGADHLVVRVEHDASLSRPTPYQAQAVLWPLCAAHQTTRGYRAPPSAPRRTVPGVARAVVTSVTPTEYESDRGNLVEVLITGMDRPCLARLAHPTAGRDHFAFFSPQERDTVLVAFTGGDPDQPVIVGSVLPRGERVPGPPACDGSLVHGDARVGLYSGGHGLSFQNEVPGRVRLQSAGELHIETPDFSQEVTATELAVTASGRVRLEAGAEVRVCASKVVIEAGRVVLDTGLVQVSGAIRCDALIATSVIATTYTPGAGNIW